MGVRDGLTYGRYICTRWELDADRVRNIVDGRRSAGRNAPHKGNKKSNNNVGNCIQADVVRDDGPSETFAQKVNNKSDKFFAEKGVKI